MPTTADLEERAIWKLEQAGYAVIIHPGHGYIVTNSSGHAIATLASLDELRALADQLDVYDFLTSTLSRCCDIVAVHRGRCYTRSKLRA